MIKKQLYKITIHLLVATLLAGVAACSSEETSVTHPEESGTFSVVAEVAPQLYSRASTEIKYIEDGTYYLSYPLTITNNPYDVASVQFGNANTDPRIGSVKVNDNQPLKWMDVGGGSTPTFYLDNVKPSSDASDNPTKIVFNNDNPDDNPYKAGRYEGDNGKNDLQWSSVQATRGVNTVNFDLHHYMSKIRVEVTVDDSDAAIPEDFNLQDAKVEITSINQIPVAYNRLDGSLELREEKTSLTLMDTDLYWENIETDEENEHITIYTTQDFVLPPQELPDDENRPRLVITLGNGDVYSGILPHAMEIAGEKADDPTIPAALSFMKEHVLTIRTLITDEPPTLSFMPVWVVEWVDKGEFDIEAHQAGIYTAAEFYRLIEYYKDNNEYQLPRYGRLNTADDTWNFDFFQSVTLDYDSIYNKMSATDKGQKDFSFNFNNYTVSVKTSSGTTTVNAETLHEIVKGKATLP